jgi:hypothetical protein
MKGFKIMRYDTNALHARSSVVYQPVSSVGHADLARLIRNGNNITSVAMELTDSWGRAMFLLDPEFVGKIFAEIGFSDDVAAGVYQTLQDIPYVEHKRAKSPTVEPVTWHKIDATCLALRGAVDLRNAMSEVDDDRLAGLLSDHVELFGRLMQIMPDFTSNLMFAPEVGERVLGTFGARVTADKLYELSWDYAGQTTRDMEGRRGIPTQFIRSASLVVSSQL